VLQQRPYESCQPHSLQPQQTNTEPHHPTPSTSNETKTLNPTSPKRRKQGQIETLDEAAKNFIVAKTSQRPALLKAAQDAATKLELSPVQKDYVEYYIKSMQRVVEKGEEYISKVRGGGGALGVGGLRSGFWVQGGGCRGIERVFGLGGEKEEGGGA